MALVVRLQHPPGTGDLPKHEREKVAPLPYVQVSRASAHHHFGTRFVMNGLQQGWISLKQGHIHLHQVPPQDDVVYRVLQVPDAQVHYFDCERVK